ncbi:MAG TPA: methionine--tRNA ligase subunit beta, partial [Burkholderiaceae bacterium]|nr:methionine--tRNA ligase subunit beta [Burkholderiaceae bacterium]
RYYIAAKLNDRVEDVDFNPDDFVARVNSDLVGKLVNIASRCAGFLVKRFGGALSDLEADTHRQLAAEWAGADAVAALYEQREFGKALREIMLLADAVNRYVDQHKPWELAKDPARADDLHRVCSTALRFFRDLIVLLAPVLPQMAARVQAFMNLPAIRWDALAAPLPAGHRINAYQHLSTRVDPKLLDALFELPGAAAAAAPAGGPATADQRPAGAASAPGTAASAADRSAQITIDDFSRVDLRVARIVAARAVEASDKLLELTVDLGEERHRTVFAGIKAHYDPAALVGRLTVVVANLAPRKMKFGTSEGMVLAASASDGSGGIHLLAPDSGATPGMRVK